MSNEYRKVHVVGAANGGDGRVGRGETMNVLKIKLIHTPEYLLSKLIPWLIPDEALYMQTLRLYQKSTKATLRLIDEVNRIAIDPACNRHPLLSEAIPTWSSSYRTDYDVFALHFTLDGVWSQYPGLSDGDGSQRQVATFGAVEV